MKHPSQHQKENECNSTPQKDQSSSQQQMTNPNSFQLAFHVPDSNDLSKMQTKILHIQKVIDCIPKGSIIIYICAPNYQGRKISVIPTDPLYIVNPIFPGDKKVYFFNGDVLNPNHSFTDYGISNRDRIVTVPAEQMNHQVEAFWRKATRSNENDKERFTGVHDRQTKQLFARSNDLILFKAESKAASNRRLMRNLMFLINDQCSTYFQTIIPADPPSHVSESSLPTLW
jgi:hypothetical protein